MHAAAAKMAPLEAFSSETTTFCRCVGSVTLGSGGTAGRSTSGATLSTVTAPLSREALRAAESRVAAPSTRPRTCSWNCCHCRWKELCDVSLATALPSPMAAANACITSATGRSSRSSRRKARRGLTARGDSERTLVKLFSRVLKLTGDSGVLMRGKFCSVRPRSSRSVVRWLVATCATVVFCSRTKSQAMGLRVKLICSNATTSSTGALGRSSSPRSSSSLRSWSCTTPERTMKRSSAWQPSWKIVSPGLRERKAKC
mmetsp:Transcript_3848/g.8957  ORF Transcript_3848/g.8957 Transcript_3848/m.8957 type:complete len:258 (+) Transcript_3848:1476-2249(+)